MVNGRWQTTTSSPLINADLEKAKQMGIRADPSSSVYIRGERCSLPFSIFHS
jgi:hypothetical protein